MGTIRGVILDVDGTLVDSNDAHAHAWVEALAEHGVTVPYEEVRRRIGMGGDKLLPAVSGIAADNAEGKAISTRRKEIFTSRYLPHLHPTPGARDLLRHFKEQGLRLAVASSARKDELEPLLRVAGADDLVGPRTSADDADESKPDPDIVQAALKELDMAPDEVVLLGDTPYDVEAAGRAGVAVLAVRCGGWDDRGLAGAIAIYDDPADLLAHCDSGEDVPHLGRKRQPADRSTRSASAE